jgi:hypothetical protein
MPGRLWRKCRMRVSALLCWSRTGKVVRSHFHLAFEGGTWSDAPNGKFKLTLPLGEAKKWLRLTLPE